MLDCYDYDLRASYPVYGRFSLPMPRPMTTSTRLHLSTDSGSADLFEQQEWLRMA